MDSDKVSKRIVSVVVVVSPSLSDVIAAAAAAAAAAAVVSAGRVLCILYVCCADVWGLMLMIHRRPAGVKLALHALRFVVQQLLNKCTTCCTTTNSVKACDKSTSC